MRVPGPAELWRSVVTETAEQADAGSRLALERHGGRRLDREAGVVLVTAVLCLTLIHFFGRPGFQDFEPGSASRKQRNDANLRAG